MFYWTFSVTEVRLYCYNIILVERTFVKLYEYVV